MQTYFAFLRAINVGGHAIVKMDALKKIFESAGMKNVKTYIQSGNVVFDSTEKDEKKLQKKIEKKLSAELGYEVPVLLRAFDELKKVSEKDPFKKFQSGKEQMVYVAFFTKRLKKKFKKRLNLFPQTWKHIKLRVENCSVCANAIQKGKPIFQIISLRKNREERPPREI